MMNQDHYNELLKLVENRTVTKQQRGMDMIVKQIPDSDVEGTLDPRVLNVMQQQAEAMAGFEAPDMSKINPIELAHMLRKQMGWPNTDVTRTGIQVDARNITGRNGEIPIRIYTPTVQNASDRLPVVVFFHGGGFFGGTLDVVENPCKAIAEKGPAVVVSVDYRLAPEHPYPAGLHDCFDAVKWTYEHADELGADKTKLAVAGDSAGGNLATVCSMMDRDLGTGMIQFQVLIYPTVNMAGVNTDDFEWKLEEYTIHDHQPYIMAGLEGMRQSSDLLDAIYLQGREKPMHPYVSPLLADLKGMPKALVITAEYDFLRLEGEAYARKLQSSGVPVTLIRYNGLDHAFMDKIGLYPQAEDCMAEIAKQAAKL
ncbi:alpha/beta hydrolase [Paenibacillus faecalis]|uniref:alpha/beta hydrolase n=1 Tax=Paenibacillus faecalis TaxID=2079532 RepID=UPI0030772201